jgi:hypothetical protein
VQVTLTLTLVNVNSSCAPISGAAIYVWHCDAAGLYSLYSSGVTTESYLRGVQVTDSNGQVTFTTIYPACYSGRWPHIHFEVFLGGLGTSPKGSTSSLISQLAMPAAINTVVFNGDSATRPASAIIRPSPCPRTMCSATTAPPCWPSRRRPCRAASRTATPRPRPSASPSDLILIPFVIAYGLRRACRLAAIMRFKWPPGGSGI